MMKLFLNDAELLPVEDSSGKTEDYAFDRETEEEKIFIWLLVQQCESMVFNESGSLASDDKVEVIETEKE